MTEIAGKKWEAEAADTARNGKVSRHKEGWLYQRNLRNSK
jgi:hypothetical protein